VDYDQVRKLTITALFSDDKLMERLVLKGGNALSLVYEITPRGSFDLDFSMAGDLTEIPDAENRIFRALRDRFDSAGFAVFDEKIRAKPQRLGEHQPASWGGYEVSFKLIQKEKLDELGGRIEDVRRQALVIGNEHRRTFTVDLSKYEYCEPKALTELDYYQIYVYTPAMIAAEKLRAICQQMPEYQVLRRPGKARARDFYDIHLLVTKAGVDLRSDLDLLRKIFAAKDVPLPLLSKISETREFHRPDWPAVIASVNETVEEFDFYFDFVLSEVSRLQSLWIE
jgi:predicted nucleotidyltransferase component of viral defense system